MSTKGVIHFVGKIALRWLGCMFRLAVVCMVLSHIGQCQPILNIQQSNWDEQRPSNGLLETVLETINLFNLWLAAMLYVVNSTLDSHLNQGVCT